MSTKIGKRKRMRAWRHWKPEEAIGKIVRNQVTQCLHLITMASAGAVKVDGSEKALDNGSGYIAGPWHSYADLMRNYRQLDGTYCGVHAWVKVDRPQCDADGHCNVCGLPWPDPKLLSLHECPPGFKR